MQHVQHIPPRRCFCQAALQLNMHPIRRAPLSLHLHLNALMVALLCTSMQVNGFSRYCTCLDYSPVHCSEAGIERVSGEERRGEER